MHRLLSAAILLLAAGCGVDGDNGSSLQDVSDLNAAYGVFSGCIDSTLFSPQECHYTCQGGQMAGYLVDEIYCRSHGAMAGDIACFCP